MVRLPIPGSDEGNWGSILNDFLSVEHHVDGTLKDTGTIADKASLTDPTFSGVVTVPAPTSSGSATTKVYVDDAVAAKYTLPGSGIPKTDLSSAVQASLDKADNSRIPRVTTLTDGATITPNCDTTDIAVVTLGGNRTIALPTGTPVYGQRLLFLIKQDATGNRTVTWASGYRFGFDVPTPTLTAVPLKSDYIGFIYNQVDNTWDGIVFAGGY